MINLVCVIEENIDYVWLVCCALLREIGQICGMSNEHC